MTDFPVITVDGPSGSGKGTISRMLADHLGWHFLDSGALYRLVALDAQHHHIDLDDDIDEASIADLARQLDVKFVSHDPQQEPIIFLDNEDVTADIRTEFCGNAASKVAALQLVREALLQRQRDFQLSPGLIADGRDMGTTVFPDAKLKIFLTASAEERAKRRHKQLKEKGIDVSLSALVKDIAERDERDGSRAVSPLKPAKEAVIVDTSIMGIDEVMEKLFLLVSESI
ncbi:Cytidylate kinase [hydrothermal vent metagenome]|uniref:(d)CMP kinase n=1 Tax=hydrothermal vent metagenome TaxID=652676 RepID=A0A3B1AAW0_9ZZZZ